MYGARALLWGLWIAIASFTQGPRPVVARAFTVVIDPGHGGSNPGCRAHDGSTNEKRVTLAVALALQRRLEQRIPHADVILTRTRDETLTLAQRTAFANAVEADVLLSLHANASKSRHQHGFETYLLDLQASGLEAARTARRENDEAMVRPGPLDPVGVMLRELEMTSHRQQATLLARRIQAQQGARFPDRLDRGVKQAPFDVLMGARMPAVLFEMGFLDHPEEGAVITRNASRARIVDGLAEAIVDYYRTATRRGWLAGEDTVSGTTDAFASEGRP